MKKKIYKSDTDKAICGVCGGIAEYFDVDSLIIRLLVVLFTLIGGSGILFYIVAAIVMPRRPQQTATYNPETGTYTYSDTYSDCNTGYTTADGTYYEHAEGQSSGQEFYENIHEAKAASPKRNNTMLILGIFLVLFGVSTFVQYFLPQISGRLIWAGAAVIAGIVMIIKKR